jgi:uncharacterized protein
MNTKIIKFLLASLFIEVYSISLAYSSTDVKIFKTERDQSVLTKNDMVKEPKVYFTKDISPNGLISVYKALGKKAQGKVAVKISTGEPGGDNYLHPELIKGLIKLVNGTIVECNTAYGGGRSSTEKHKQVAEDHGFTTIAPVDIMDADGSINLPFEKGEHIKRDIVGSHFKNYDFFIILNHFKGHAMAGFGGAIKNMSIGIASAGGKMLIHSAGKVDKAGDFGPAMHTSQDAFLESMAEAACAVENSLGKHIIYISVMNNLSVDCDCDSHPAPPTMANVGILASTDPVALDQACVDLVYKSPDSQDLIKRIESRHGIHVLEYGEKIGLGKRRYKLINVDE